MLEATALALDPSATIALASPRHILSITAYAGATAALESSLGVALPEPGHTAISAGVTWLWSGPNSWLAMSETPLDLAPATPHAALTDQSDGKAVFLVHGALIRETLQKLIPIDLHETLFLPDHTALTLAGHIPVQIWREGEVFALACFRSFGPALHHALLEA
jgi:heterotetrameric sarcosine oxidase gamma subunit